VALSFTISLFPSLLPLPTIGSLAHSIPHLITTFFPCWSDQDSYEPDRVLYLQLTFHVQLIHFPDDGGNM
jgi:hypothetical protein